MAVYLIGNTLFGIVFIIIGIWQMKTGSVSLLHDYHTVCVSPADKPKLAWRTGIDEVVIGILVAVGVPFVAWTQMSFSEQDSLAYYVAGIAFTVFLFIPIIDALRAIKKYNGSIFGIKPPTG